MKGLIVLVILAVVILVGFTLLGPKGEEEQGGQLELVLNGLEPLELGSYEGWIITGEEKVSTGKFNIGDITTFALGDDAEEADSFAVTIEPEGDSDNVPSGIVVVSGAIIDGKADLAFVADLSSVGGSYILATPTDGADNNEKSGVWFITLPPPLTAGLTLPTLPSGWIYEGWAVHNGVPLTTGRFASAEGNDLFSGYSGDEEHPAFPGEDFLVNAPDGVEFPVDLTDEGSLVVISIEPDAGGIDPTGDKPFSIKPLVASVSSDAVDHTNYEMALNMASLPSGTAIIIMIDAE